MTVAELIAKLAEFDPAMPVKAEFGEPTEMTEAEDIAEVTLWPPSGSHGERYVRLDW